MTCVGVLAISAGAPHVSSPATDDIGEEDRALVQYAQPSRMIGGPLMMEAAQKVDRCLARLQSLQGTVSLPAPAVSATVSACMSPVYSRSKSCIGSSRSDKEEESVIRIHDILRFSDDFTGKIPTLPQDQRGKYLRRLSRSKTEVFDDKKDPRDPHGEWKHWSSGAGDVHKVVSEILMASQIAKEITSMVNACLVNGELGSSDEEKPSRKTKHKHNNTHNNHSKMKAQASSSNNKGSVIAAAVYSSSKRILKKQDPMHKFRVMTPSESSKRRHNSAGATSSRKEVLYPKSKPTAADLMRPSAANLAQEISSTERKMQSRRSSREGVSPRLSADEPIRKSRSKTVAAPSEPRKVVIALTTSRVSSSADCSSLSGSKNHRRGVVITGENSRAAAAASHRRRQGSSSAAGTPRASIDTSSQGSHAYKTLARDQNAAIENGPASKLVETTARLSAEESLLRKSTSVRAAYGVEPTAAPRSVHASADDLVWSRIRARVAGKAPESHRNSSSSVLDVSSTRVRTDSSSDEPVLRNHGSGKATAAESTGTFRSLEVEESSGGNKNFRVGTADTYIDPVLARIRTRVAAASENFTATSMAQPQPKAAAAAVEEDPLLTRIRARVTAAAEPLVRKSVTDEELQGKHRSRAGAGTPRKSVATTSSTWEAKEITNCYNSPRAAAGELLSKKQAAATATTSTMPSSSVGGPAAGAIKRVRSSRSPPLAYHETSASGVAVGPRLSSYTVGAAAVQSSSTFWRDTFNKIQVEQQKPAAATVTYAPISEALLPGQSSKFSRSPARSRTGSADGSSSSGVRKAHQLGVPTTVAGGIGINIPNFVTNAEITHEDNASVTSTGSYRNGRNEDWFKKSLEATEISLGPSSKLLGGKFGGNNKAVLFSNPTFAPASPPGARPSPGKSTASSPAPTATVTNNPNPAPVRQPSPKRSTSATRRMREWVGNILPRRRSISPNIGGRFTSPLPSLISRLPSRGRKSSVSAPRASVFPFSSSRKESVAAVEQLPLPPCLQAQQLAASKLTELPARREVLGLKTHKEKMDRQAQAHHMAAQKLVMVQNWNRTVEPPAPFEKDVGVAEQLNPPAPFVYSKRQLNDMGRGYDDDDVKKHLEGTECDPKVHILPNVRYSWGTKERETSATDKENEIVEVTQGLAFAKREGVAPRVLSQCKSVNQVQGTVAAAAAWNVADKENIGPAACKGVGGGVLRKSCSVNSQRSTSTIRAVSTGKIRPGQSFLKRAKDWMRTQTPFRDRPQKIIAA